MDALLTKQQVASLLQVSVRTLDRLRSTGALRAVRVRGAVRFRAADIERLVQKGGK